MDDDEVAKFIAAIDKLRKSFAEDAFAGLRPPIVPSPIGAWVPDKFLTDAERLLLEMPCHTDSVH